MPYPTCMSLGSIVITSGTTGPKHIGAYQRYCVLQCNEVDAVDAVDAVQA